MSFAPSQSLSSRAQDTLLGLFVVVAVLLAGWLLFEDLQEQHADQLRFRANLSSSFGLSVGSPVKINGVSVGRIDNIRLSEQGQVALDLVMQREYQPLYRAGSRLKIDSTLAIDNVLSGAAIAFIPGPAGQLQNGALLEAEEPRSIQDLMQEWDIQALSQKVADILVNLDNIVTNVSDNQDSLTKSLENVAALTSSMTEASQQLPDVLNQMQRTMQVMENTLQEGSQTVNDNMATFAGVAEQSAQLMESINAIAVNMEPTVADMPETQALLNNLLFEVNGLTRQLRQHWLLQGGEPAPIPGKGRENNGLFPPDESLYDPAVPPPVEGESKS